MFMPYKNSLRFLRRFLSRSKTVGVAFSETHIGIFSSSIHHSSDYAAGQFEQSLAELVTKLGLSNSVATLSLPLSKCKIKTVSLPRCSLRELRHVLKQELFWQEYLNVDLREYQVWWQRMRFSSIDEIQVLIAAAPIEEIQRYTRKIKQAGFASCLLGVSCFDFFAAMKHQKKFNCLVVINSSESFIIGSGDFGFRMHLVTPDMQAESFALELTRLMKGDNAADNTSVQVGVIVDRPEKFPEFLKISEFLPANFSLEMVSAQQLANSSTAQCYVTAGAVLRHRYTHCYADFSINTSVDSRHYEMIRLRKLWPIFSGLGLFVLGTQAYLHWMFYEEHQQLSEQMVQYRTLEEKHQQYEKEVSSLHKEINRQSAILDGISQLELSDSLSTRILNIIEQAASNGIWLSKTQFKMPAVLHLEGKAIDSETVVHYVNALQEYDVITEVHIKSLSRPIDDELITFFLECSLNTPLRLTDA